MRTLRQPHQPDALTTLLETLRRRAVRQQTTLKIVTAATVHAPTFDDCAASVDRTGQALEHLEGSVDLYRELGGGDLMAELSPLLVKQSGPESWLEAAVAQLVLSLAAVHDARAPFLGAHLTDPLSHTLAEEAELVDAARAALGELGRTSPLDGTAVSTLVMRWLPVALQTLERGARRDYTAALQREIERLGWVIDAAILAA